MTAIEVSKLNRRECAVLLDDPLLERRGLLAWTVKAIMASLKLARSSLKPDRSSLNPERTSLNPDRSSLKPDRIAPKPDRVWVSWA